MQPRLYMQTIQFATYKQHGESITFETRHVSGRRYHFVLTKNQFLALDYVIALIQCDDTYGHYPLGQNMWLDYNPNCVRLYKQRSNGDRLKFHFVCFEEYKRHVHSRLRSLLLLNRNEAGRRRRKYGESSTASNQRPLSIAMQPTHQPSTTKRRCWGERKAALWATDNVNMSHDDKACSILSERNSTNSRRRSDSFSSKSSLCSDFSSIDSIRLNSQDGTMESE